MNVPMCLRFIDKTVIMRPQNREDMREHLPTLTYPRSETYVFLINLQYVENFRGIVFLDKCASVVKEQG